ncbi:LacI family DNA-binding transcriptional regulator [Aestuariibius insulae]|uniref:LacI family DNA-binding transcriptional regulator n=1 Tax=Aestuariibius insulae TaxID=2058287 RepID=UPI00345E873F
MTKPTVHDIAKEAGVSLATVDRVLNARSGVRDQTVTRVKAAVHKLGYVRDTHAANLARQRQYRFVFALPGSDDPFVKALSNALSEATEAQQADRITARHVVIPTGDAHGIAGVLDRLDPETVDGLAVMAPETPQLRDAIARLKAKGIAVVAFVSDLPNSDRDHFVGINSLKAGRTAGTLMGRFLSDAKADILVVTPSMLARDSIERRLGFDAVLSEGFPTLSVLPTIETHDDPARIRTVVTAAIAAHPKLAGIYSMGTTGDPLIEAIRASGRAKDLVMIAHDLTPLTRTGLIEGHIDAVIAQNVGHLVRSALRVLRAKCDGTEIFEAQETIRIDIVIRENLP